MSVILDGLVDFVYPKKCVVCKKGGEMLCFECLNNLEYADQICPECGESSNGGWTHKGCLKRDGMEGLVAIYDYGDPQVKKMVESIKFGFNREILKRVLGSLKIDLGEKFDLVVPIPLYKYRENWRGFNQAQIMAEEVAKLTDLEWGNVLKRIKNTKQQAKSVSKKERFENLKNAFSVVDTKMVKGKNILIVDDVFTTGASMKEAVRCLKTAGVKNVWGLVLGH